MENAEQAPSILTPDFTMVILTWVTFFLLVFILKKFAWKPILDALQKREDYIRHSLEDADKAKAQLAEVEGTKAKILNEAKTQAAQIINDARKTARDVAHDIEAAAKTNAQSIVHNASAQIDGERQRVRDALKKESAQVAIALAGKILKEDTDTAKNRKLVEDEIRKV